MSLTAYADEDDTKAYSAYDVTTDENKDKSGDDLTKLQVTFNGKKWYIIEDNSTAVDKGTVTLLAVDSFGTSKFSESGYNYSNSIVKRMLDEMTESGGSFARAAYAIKTIHSLKSLSNAGGTLDEALDVKLYLLSYNDATKLSREVKKCQEAGGGCVRPATLGMR